MANDTDIDGTPYRPLLQTHYDIIMGVAVS